MGARNLNSLEEHLKSTSAFQRLLGALMQRQWGSVELLERGVKQPAEVVIHLAL